MLLGNSATLLGNPAKLLGNPAKLLENLPDRDIEIDIEERRREKERLCCDGLQVLAMLLGNLHLSSGPFFPFMQDGLHNLSFSLQLVQILFDDAPA
jgi:hypothetical protein